MVPAKPTSLGLGNRKIDVEQRGANEFTLELGAPATTAELMDGERVKIKPDK